MLTLATLVSKKWVTAWALSGSSLPVRNFYYTLGWLKEFNGLPAQVSVGAVRAATPRARLAALVEQFVRGDRKAILVTPVGNGMDPVFARMRAPHSAVVEMRTSSTRTFGFFPKIDTFVAVSLETKESLVQKHKQLPNSDPYLEHATRVEKLLNMMSASDVEATREIDDLITD